MARLFTDVIRDIAGGELVDEATTAINNLVTAVDETGKGGSLTMKITVKPNGRGGGMNVSAVRHSRVTTAAHPGRHRKAVWVVSVAQRLRPDRLPM